jgi:hypothetical protein
MSDISAPLRRIHAGIGMIETAMTRRGLRRHPDGFVPDDITPCLFELRCLLGKLDAALRAALHDR